MGQTSIPIFKKNVSKTKLIQKKIIHSLRYITPIKKPEIIDNSNFKSSF